MTPTLSARWHRVAAACPAWRPGVQVRRHRVRGETWHVATDPASGRSVRLNRAAYAVAGRLDGRLSLQALWDRWAVRQADGPTQDEVIDTVAALAQAGLLAAAPQGVAATREASDAQAPPLPLRALAWRWRAGNPSALLDRLATPARLAFSRAGAWAMALALAWLVFALTQHGPALWAHGAAWLATPRYALLAALLYAPMKAWHELAHGLAVQRWGGRVHEAGITFVLGLPMPYVDASAASAWPSRRRRALVSSAGMLAELALAAVALAAWLHLDEGWPRDGAFVLLVIGGVSTVLFNANPLQRLDGHHLLTDLLAVPNLATRSRRWWGEALQARLAGVPPAAPLVPAAGEAQWLVAFAPLSWACAIGIGALGVAWLGQLSWVAGAVGAALIGWQVLIHPATRLLGELHRSAQALPRSAQRWRRALAGGVLAGLAALAIPVPDAVVVRGVVWPADEAQVRAGEEGTVVSVAVASGDTVRAGDVLLLLGDPALEAQHAQQAARVAALESQLFGALPPGAAPAATAADVQAALQSAQAELARLQARREALTVRAGTAGRVVLPDAVDLPGRRVLRGALLGQVLTRDPVRVRVALPHDEAPRLDSAGASASVRLAGSTSMAHGARLAADSRAAVRLLPSAALSQRHGGPIATDPQDADDRRALQPVVLIDVVLEGTAADAGWRIGERAAVRLDAGAAPVALQAARALRRAAMQRFNPQA